MAAGIREDHRTWIGVISDTHGFLHPAVAGFFHPVGRIVHAGDIGGPDILTALGQIAPVTAVRGNMDSGSWASVLPAFEIVQVESLRLCVLHDRDRLDLDPQQAKIHAVISGHTHRPHLKTEDGVLYVNPGSASHPRRRHPPTVAMMKVVDGRISAQIIELNPRA